MVQPDHLLILMRERQRDLARRLEHGMLVDAARSRARSRTPIRASERARPERTGLKLALAFAAGWIIATVL